MPTVKSNRQLWGTEFPIGEEWDAGTTAPHIPAERSGRWTVRREAERFIVIFHRYGDGVDVPLETFPPTEQGEIEAKTCAIAAREKNQISQNKEQ